MRAFRLARAAYLSVPLALTAAIAISASASAAPRTTPVRTVYSSPYAVSISIPASWRPTPGIAPAGNGYDGATGWFEFNAMAGPFTQHRACIVAASGNVLHPYGLHPRIQYRTIDGRPGCLIIASKDAVRQSRRPRGPAFKTSALLVEYRHPVGIGGSRYAWLEVYTDPAHLAAIAASCTASR